jgi:hypothetical protein
MSDEQIGHGMSRLDRMEGLMQLLIDDTRERLDTLIITVDDLIRGRPL